MAALGVDDATERLYRVLLRNPGSSTGELAALLSKPPSEIADAVVHLQHRGLARAEGSGSNALWHATAPDVAVELLLVARQAELNEARMVLPELQEDLLQGAQRPGAGGLQVIPADAQSQLQAYLQLHQCARQSLAVLLCPPFGVSAPDEIESARTQARQRGVQFRILMDPELLQWPGWTEAVRLAGNCGDVIRARANLPFKMVLADDRAGLVPMNPGATAGPSLLLGPGAVLDAMHFVFETLWRDAAPAAIGNDVAQAEGDAADKDLSLLLSLLAAGSNDKSIADSLGISERTLQRRIQMLHVRLGAKTRFHCGWLAAREVAGQR